MAHFIQSTLFKLKNLHREKCVIKQNTSILFTGCCQEAPEGKAALGTRADIAATEPQPHAEGPGGHMVEGSPPVLPLCSVLGWARGDPPGPGNSHHLPPAWKSKSDGITVGTTACIRHGAPWKESGAAPVFIPFTTLSPHYTAHPVFSDPSGPAFGILFLPFWYLLDFFLIICHSSFLSPHFFIYKISPLLLNLHRFHTVILSMQPQVRVSLDILDMTFSLISRWFLQFLVFLFCLCHFGHCLGPSSVSCCCPNHTGRTGQLCNSNVY